MADSLAESHLNRTVHAAGAAAEFAAECKGPEVHRLVQIFVVYSGRCRDN